MILHNFHAVLKSNNNSYEWALAGRFGSPHLPQQHRISPQLY